ncbi:hypothetical protein [Streptomyces katrae]|uniref:hypothetical protein n=1 Tax=Streptomyces katrae TaxID=68223 RepID=UPI003307A207
MSSVRNDLDTVDYANWLTRLGGQVRTVPSLPTRVITTDRATAVIPVNSEDSGAAAVVLTGQGTLSALCALFETIWSGAQALGEAAVRDGHGLSSQEAATVGLLALRPRSSRNRAARPLWATAVYVQRIALPQVRDPGQS